jgi:hypothetical protein
MKVYSEQELDKTVKVLSQKVQGEYIARIDDKRKTTRGYEVEIEVPDGFNLSHVKTATRQALAESKDYPDFVYMRTFECAGNAKDSTKRSPLRKVLSREKLALNKRFQERALREAAKNKKSARKVGGVIEDESDYDANGLPPVIG